MLFYEKHTRGNKTPLIFLHGFLGSREDFENSLPLFLENYSVYLFDLPGHGKSTFSPSSGSSFEEITRELKNCLEKENIQKCSIIGYSLGGRIALHFAHRYPHLVDRLILLSSHLGLETFEEKRLRHIRDVHASKEIIDDFSSFLMCWYTQPIFQGISSWSGFSSMIEKRKQNDSKELAKVLLAFSLSKQKVFMPKKNFLFLCGEKDVTYQALYQIRKCTYDVIEDASHALHLENPSAWAQRAQEFLMQKENV